MRIWTISVVALILLGVASTTEAGSSWPIVSPLSSPPEADRAPLPLSCIESFIFVTEYASGKLTGIDIVSGGTTLVTSGLGNPTGVAISGDESTAYVVESGTGTLVAIDLRPNSFGVITQVVNGLSSPFGIALDAAGEVAYVTESGSGELSVVELSTGVVSLVTSGLGDPRGVATNPLDVAGSEPSFVYLTEAATGELSAVDVWPSPSFGSIYALTSGLAAPEGLALNATNTTAFVAETGSGELSSVDIVQASPTFGIITRVTLGLSQPSGVAIDSAATTAYVTEAASGEVSAVNLRTGSTTLVIDGLDEPKGIALACIGLTDTDQDGIPDVVELNGVRDTDGNLVADMATLGADPCRKTVAVEIDFMVGALDGHSHRPMPGAIAEAVDAFNNAPVPAVSLCPFAGFPIQSSGVNLVVDVDDPIAEVEAMSFGSGFETAKAANFEVARRPYFHYNLWVHNLSPGLGYSGIAEIHGNDLIVSLGSWPNQVGTLPQQSGTFMHELGHNLGFGHGGGDHVNGKPNYLSVMSYSFQTVGLYNGTTGVTRIDYSREELPQLDEFSLDENAGIGDRTLFTVWRDLQFNLRAGQGDGPLDWTGNDFDSDGVTDNDSPVNVDINGDGICVTSGSNGVLDTLPTGDDVVLLGAFIHDGPNHKCDTAAMGDDVQYRAVGTTQTTDLTGFDDWVNLDYIFTDDPSYANGVHEVPDEPELTFEDAQVIEEFWATVTPAQDDGTRVLIIVVAVILAATTLAVIVWYLRRR